MMRENCIFCNNILDDSDEHVIPDCINGRLRSTNIICRHCNTKFGTTLEAAVKKLFNSILLILDFDNANGMFSYDPDGTRYLYRNNKTVSTVKPELRIVNKEGKTYVSVEGDKKNVIKFFAKRAKEFLMKGYKPLKFDVVENESESPPFTIHAPFEINPEIVLELNKIALEFYALCGLDLNMVNDLLSRVNALDSQLDNVIFCNFDEKIRTFDSEEASHLIVVKTNQKNELYCYIELFNVICAYIKLFENCGENISFVYYQDALTGKRLTEEITVNLNSEPQSSNTKNNFDSLINALFERVQSREFSKVLQKVFDEIRINLEQQVDDGKLDKNKFTEEYTNQCAKAIAEISVYEFPYMVEDFKDEENHEINYIHSNLQDTQYEAFCEFYKNLTGIKVTFPDENVYIFSGFYKQSFLKRNGITLVKVFCVLTHQETQRKKYIPYREFFEGVVPDSTVPK